MDNVLEFAPKQKTKTARRPVGRAETKRTTKRDLRPSERKSKENQEAVNGLSTNEKLKIIAKALSLWEDGVDVKEYMHKEAKKVFEAKREKEKTIKQ